MSLNIEQLRRWRDEASENIERIDNARGLSPGTLHVNQLLRPREARILTLCDALLDQLGRDHGAEREHLLTTIDEGSGFTPICSCGWTGPTYESTMAAGLAWSMHHSGRGGEGR